MKKKNKILTIILIIVSVLLVAMVAAFVITKNELDTQELQNEIKEATINQNKKTVYVVSTLTGEGIRHGEIIEENVNVIKQTVFTGLEGYNYITQDDLGSTAIVDIYEGMTVMSNMVTPVEIATDTREYEMQVVNLMVDQKENDYVDIRIMFPDGSDFLVLPKKQVKNLNLEQCVFWAYLNEEEILRMASATIDAFTITGTKIYATRYVESNLQDDGIPTYLVNSSVQQMMDSSSAYYDPNLLTIATDTLNSLARATLESKLEILSKEALAAVSEGHGLEDTAKSSVLAGSSGVDYDAYVEQQANNSYGYELNNEEFGTTGDDTSDASNTVSPVATPTPTPATNTGSVDQAGVTVEAPTSQTNPAANTTTTLP